MSYGLSALLYFIGFCIMLKYKNAQFHLLYIDSDGVYGDVCDGLYITDRSRAKIF